jgi:ABC-type Fe3+/spermidine/putrescine transport system ATPase subunit
MRDGRIVERGRPVDIYRRPRDVFTAQCLPGAAGGMMRYK